MKEVVRRGQYRDLFDEAGWPARVTALAPHERSKALLMGLRVFGDARREGDHASARQLLFGLAGVLDVEITEQGGPMPYSLLDLRLAVRGPRRWACATLEEVLTRLQTLAGQESWAFSRTCRPDLVRQRG